MKYLRSMPDFTEFNLEFQFTKFLVKTHSYILKINSYILLMFWNDWITRTLKIGLWLWNNAINFNDYCKNNNWELINFFRNGCMSKYVKLNTYELKISKLFLYFYFSSKRKTKLFFILVNMLRNCYWQFLTKNQQIFSSCKKQIFFANVELCKIR